MQDSSFKIPQTRLRAVFAPPKLLLYVSIPAFAQTLGTSASVGAGALSIQPSHTHAPILLLLLHMENFIASICLRFLDLSQRVSVYVLDWSHFPSHFYQLKGPRSSILLHHFTSVWHRSLYYCPFFIILYLTLYLTQQSGV